MQLRLDDTIVAVGTPAGPAARGIVRLGGPEAVSILHRVLRPERESKIGAARPFRCLGSVDVDGVPLAVAAHVWPTTRSYIGQPLVELHTVGAPPLLDHIVTRLREEGARPAGRGEFTLRAFLAGRLDLVRAEAVLGVIDADDGSELELALRQLAGGVSSRMHAVRSDLLDLLSDLEAGLDFVDEDIEFVSNEAIVRRLVDAERFVTSLLERASERMQSTARRIVVLAGLPNAGKSTLFNRFVGEGSALVSDRPGTTRDYLVAPVTIGGVPIELVDTAGWEWEPDTLSAGAMQLRAEQLVRADLVVWCTAAGLAAEERAADADLRRECPRNVLAVGTKRDLGAVPDTEALIDARSDDLHVLAEAIASRLRSSDRERGELLATTSARCRASLVETAESLDRARRAAESDTGDEIVAMETRAALNGLASIVGEVYTDDVLDRVFSKFCIGK